MGIRCINQSGSLKKNPYGKKHRNLNFIDYVFCICSYLIELLANEGFLIVSVPYNVTFDHAEAAKEVYERFNSCLDNILTSGLPDVGLSASELACLPLYSVGHR